MALFSPSVMLLDSGSLTAQSVRVAVQNMPEAEVLTDRIAAVGIMVMLNSVANMARNFNSVPIFVNDRYPVRKLNQFPGYKKDRFERYTQVYTNIEAGLTEVPEGEQLSLHQQFRKVIQPLLKTLPVVQAHAAGEEGDDAMATANVQIGRVSGAKRTIFTRDTDMFQLVGKPKLTVIYKMHGQGPIQVSESFVLEKYPVKRPSQIPLFKALLGDAGDSVPKIARMHQSAILRDVIAERETVQEVFDAWWNDEISQEGWHKGWDYYLSGWLGEDEEQKGQAFINEKITRLNEDCNVVYEYTGGDYAAFLDIYQRYQAQAHGINMLDPLQLWNLCTQWAQEIARVFDKDRLALSNPGINLQI